MLLTTGKQSFAPMLAGEVLIGRNIILQLNKMSSCARISIHDTTSFAFNILLHALILFAVLSGIFVFYISKVEKDVFKSEVGDSIRDKLPEALRQQDKDGKLKSILKELPLDKISALYEKPDECTKMYNSWLFTTMIIVIAGAFIATLVSALFLYYTCGKCIPFWTILWHNFLIFLFIGIVEGLFFFYIARRFVPAPPSLLISRVFKDLKNW